MTPTERGTPRTDEISEKWYDTAGAGTVALIDLARQLERELAEKQARVAELETRLELAERAKQELRQGHQRVRDELTAERQRAEGIAELLRMFRDEIVAAIGTGGTHYEGCENNHKNCKWLKLINDALTISEAKDTERDKGT